jgi:hypothetical protein
MDPQYSVLLFSKYSSNCKKMFDIISASGIDILDIHIQLLCIDNESIRQRIKQNNQIDVSSVPCILSIFSNGKVEKYDGSYAFSWIETLISRLKPPPPPPPPIPPAPPAAQHRKQPPPRKTQTKIRPRPEPREEVGMQEIERDTETDTETDIERDLSQPSRDNQTSIENIIYEEEESQEETDRHITKPPPRRIRQDEGSYIEDDNLFSGEMTDNRKQPKNTTKGKADKKTVDSNGIKAKADELAKLRELDDKQLGHPARRPLGDRRP